MITLFSLAGSSAIVIGALLPWMTFFAGLQRISGVSGAYGKALLAVGIASAVVAVLARIRTTQRVWRQLSIVLGAGASVAAVVLLVRAMQFTSSDMMRMMVPRVGPGLWVVAAGGAVAALTALTATALTATTLTATTLTDRR